MLQVHLRLLSDGFSCVAVEPSTAIIHILDGGNVDEDEEG
jgi:RecB family endonuclease NucS